MARDDVKALMDHLGLERAHIVGHSMGAYTTLHMGLRYPGRCISLTAAGCGWGSNPAEREQSARLARDIARLFKDEGIAAAAAKYADFRDAPAIQGEGSARLGAIPPLDERALGRGPCAHHAARAARAADALGPAARASRTHAAAARHRRRRGCRLPRRQRDAEAYRAAGRAARAAARGPYDQQRGAGGVQPSAARTLFGRGKRALDG